MSPAKKTRLKLRGRLHTFLSFSGHTLSFPFHTIEIEEDDKQKKLISSTILLENR